MSTQVLPRAMAGNGPMRRDPRAPATGPTLTAKDIIGILRRRVWMILIITILCAGLSCFLWFILRRTSSKYTSVGLIRVKMPVQPDLLGGRDVMFRPEVIETQLVTRSLYLMNRGFLSSVLQRVKVQQTNWFKSFQDEKERMENLEDSFAAMPQRNSQFLQVAMTTSSAQEAQLILNEILEQFRQDMVEEATEELRRSLKALQDQTTTQDRELTTAQSKLIALTSAANVPPGWNTRDNVVTAELGLLHEEKLRLETLVKAATMRLEELKRDREQGLTISSLVQSSVDNDPQIRNFQQRISGLTETQERLLDRLGQEHLQVRELQRSIESVQELLNQRTNELQYQYSIMERRQLERGQAELEIQLDEITERYAQVSQDQSTLDRMVREYNQTEAQVNRLTRRLQKYEDEIRATRVKMDNPDRVRAEIASHATMPLSISFPKLAVFLPGGIFLGLLLSLGLAFLLEFLDDSVKTPADVGQHLHMPLLGMIPLHEQDVDDDQAGPLQMVAHGSSQSLISEYYRMARTNLQFMRPEGELKTILVTSCSAGCGKTTGASNLAITFAADGKQVLLVDGNFRKPAVSGFFEIADKGSGLSNVLIGNCKAVEAIRSSGLENLDVLDSGPPPPNPSYLLNGPLMRQLLDQQKRKYDYVIIDGPPALVVTDARILAGQVDGTIIVIRAGNTSRGVANRMCREISSPGVRIVGILLNGVKARRGGYFAKHFQSYYDYVAQADQYIQPDSETVMPQSDPELQSDPEKQT